MAPQTNSSRPAGVDNADNDTVLIPSPSDASQSAMPDVFRMNPCNNLNLHEISVDELQFHYASGALSAVEYVRYCLDRIQKVCIMYVTVPIYLAFGEFGGEVGVFHAMSLFLARDLSIGLFLCS